jgi:hypothetical protein
MARKYTASLFAKISIMHSAVPPRSEGRIAIVTNVERGMRWTRLREKTKRADADGEVVWS